MRTPLKSTIALNIVFGIIVDTFSELRNARYEIEEDRLNSCFICSLKGDEFERAGTRWNRRIDGDKRAKSEEGEGRGGRRPRRARGE